MNWKRNILFSFYLCNIFLFSTCLCYNEFIDSFQTLSYRPVLGVDRFRRSSLSSNNASPIHLRFQSHNRTFHLLMHPRKLGIFAEDHVFEINGITQEVEAHEIFYDGYVIGDPASSVHGSIIDGVFEGHIETGIGETFTVEKAARYFDKGSRPGNYHSIIYADGQINTERFHLADVPDEEFANSDGSRRMPLCASGSCGSSVSGHNMGIKAKQVASNMKSDLPVHEDLSDGQVLEKLGMKRIHGKEIYKTRTCSMHILVDHKLYEAIYEKEGNLDASRTNQEIVSLVGNHMQEVNRIFKNTDFGGIKGINFVIQRTKIYDKDSCLGENKNPFCVEGVDVSGYLDILSQQDHKDFCLAYALTHRDFSGVLGLAWVAQPDSTAGGICETHRSSGSAKQSRSLNTGVVTLINFGRRVPVRTSALTLAHEIGHNFGAPHDTKDECQPGGENGNYIMFPKASDGYKPNNEKFSSCSKKEITSVLFSLLQEDPDAPQRGRKRNCFHQGSEAFCGNQIVEKGEQCDCGFDESDCNAFPDECCVPKLCRLKPGKRCSPSQGTCCGQDCNPLDAGSLCGMSPECRRERKCDGRSAKCPDGVPEENGKTCLSSTKVCLTGECKGSVCEDVGLTDCFLTSGKPEKLCQLACEKNGVCTSTYELEEFKNDRFMQNDRNGEYGLRILPGQPCNNLSGYCDMMFKCRSVDSNGPLARVKNLLLNPSTRETVSNWMEENWWACIPIGILFVSCFCLLVKCCSVHTPSGSSIEIAREERNNGKKDSVNNGKTRKSGSQKLVPV